MKYNKAEMLYITQLGKVYQTSAKGDLEEIEDRIFKLEIEHTPEAKIETLEASGWKLDKVICQWVSPKGERFQILEYAWKYYETQR